MPAFYPEGDDPKIGDAPNRSLQKINSLLKSIDTKTGSTTITGPVTVSNEVEVTNSTGNPIPVSGTVALDSNSLAALENISVTFPATQNVNVTNAGLNVSVTNLPATQPVSLATVPSHAVTGPLTDTELRATAVPVSVKNGVPAITTTGVNHPVTSFTASTKTITIANFPNSPVIGNFLLITNTTRGIIVHNSVDPQKICTFGSLNYNGQFWSITATFPASVDASGMQNSDTFHVVYAPEAVGNPIASQVELVGRTQTGSRGSALLSTGITGALLVDAGVAGGVGTASESAASTDTSISGINGLLKRLLQRLTTLLPANLTVSSTRLLVDGSGVTQPVSGTVTANTGLTQPLTDTQLRAASVPISQGTAANLNATVVQGTATNLRTAAEVYTNGFPISSTNALTIKTTNAYGSNQPVVQLGYSISGVGIVTPSDSSGFPIRPSSSATFPVTDNGGSLTVDGTVTVNDMTSGNAKTKIVDSVGADVSYIIAGTAGTPSAGVLSVQGINGGVSLPISGTVNTYPLQGTSVSNTNFSSITSAELAPASANRKSLTVYNEGSGTLFINVGGSCSTTSYQVRLFSGEYWECPQGQQAMAHSAIFQSAGTARVTQVS